MTISKSLKCNLLLKTVIAHHTNSVMCISTTLTSHGNKIKNTGDDDIKSREDSIMSDNNNNKSKQLYLHIAPCGDYWTGHGRSFISIQSYYICFKQIVLFSFYIIFNTTQ